MATKFTKTQTAEAAKASTKTKASTKINVEFGETQYSWNGQPCSAEEFIRLSATPTWQRQIINSVAGLVGYGTTLYFGMSVANLLAAVAVATTGVGFVSFMVAFLASVAAFFAAFTVGKAVYEFAAMFDVNKVSGYWDHLMSKVAEARGINAQGSAA